MFEPQFLGQVRLGQFGWVQDAVRRASPPPNSGDFQDYLKWQLYWWERDPQLPTPPFNFRYKPSIREPQPPQPPPLPVETPITNALPPAPGVASIDCSYMGPYSYFDGRQCRSSNMTASAGGLINQAMNFGPSGGGGMVSPGTLDFNPGSVSAASFGGMGRRYLGQAMTPLPGSSQPSPTPSRDVPPWVWYVGAAAVLVAGVAVLVIDPKRREIFWENLLR